MDRKYEETVYGRKKKFFVERYTKIYFYTRNKKLLVSRHAPFNVVIIGLTNSQYASLLLLPAQ